jgi:hypothetical protein
MNMHNSKTAMVRFCGDGVSTPLASIARRACLGGRVDAVRLDTSLTYHSADAPKYPVVLAHGLLGFSELRLAGPYLPSISYWRGIKDALTANRAEIILTQVPPTSSIGPCCRQVC